MNNVRNRWNHRAPSVHQEIRRDNTIDGHFISSSSPPEEESSKYGFCGFTSLSRLNDLLWRRRSPSENCFACSVVLGPLATASPIVRDGGPNTGTLYPPHIPFTTCFCINFYFATGIRKKKSLDYQNKTTVGLINSAHSKKRLFGTSNYTAISRWNHGMLWSASLSSLICPPPLPIILMTFYIWRRS